MWRELPNGRNDLFSEVQIAPETLSLAIMLGHNKQEASSATRHLGGLKTVEAQADERLHIGRLKNDPFCREAEDALGLLCRLLVRVISPFRWSPCDDAFASVEDLCQRRGWLGRGHALSLTQGELRHFPAKWGRQPVERLGTPHWESFTDPPGCSGCNG